MILIIYPQLTNPQQAHQEFVKARMNGVDRTNDPRYSLLPPGKGQSSKGDKQQNLASFTSVHSVHRISHGSLSKTAKIIIIAVAAVVLIIAALLVFFLFRCISRRNNRRRVARFGFKGVDSRQAPQVYQPLSAPAPQAHPGYNDPKSFGGYGYYGSGPATQ